MEALRCPFCHHTVVPVPSGQGLRCPRCFNNGDIHAEPSDQPDPADGQTLFQSAQGQILLPPDHGTTPTTTPDSSRNEPATSHPNNNPSSGGTPNQASPAASIPQQTPTPLTGTAPSPIVTPTPAPMPAPTPESGSAAGATPATKEPLANPAGTGNAVAPPPEATASRPPTPISDAAPASGPIAVGDRATREPARHPTPERNLPARATELATPRNRTGTPPTWPRDSKQSGWSAFSLSNARTNEESKRIICPACNQKIPAAADFCPVCRNALTVQSTTVYMSAGRRPKGPAPRPQPPNKFMSIAIGVGILAAPLALVAAPMLSMELARIFLVATAILVGADAAYLKLGRLRLARMPLTRIERMGAPEWAILSILFAPVLMPVYAIRRGSLWRLAQQVERAGKFDSPLDLRTARRAWRSSHPLQLSEKRRRARIEWMIGIAGAVATMTWLTLAFWKLPLL